MLSFARDIRPFFRDKDVDGMRDWFDLSSHADVTTYAQGIYDTLKDGSMPCDGPWPANQVELFRQWIDEGSAP